MIRVHRLMTIARKEFRQIRRDTRSLVLAFMVPVQMLLLFGYAISWDVRNIALSVIDEDGTQSSRSLIDAFRSSGYFVVSQQLTRPAQATGVLERGVARAVLVIPRRFEQSIMAGRQSAAAQLLVDGADANTATIVIGYAQATLSSWATRRDANRAVRSLAPQTRVWYNETLETRNMIIPGMVASIMMIVGSMMSA